MSTPDKDVSTAKPKSRKLLFLVAGVVLIGASGGGWYWWTSHQPVSAEGAHHGPAEPAAPPAVGSLLALETFTVNLADPGTARYLRVTVQLVVAGKATAGEIEHDRLALMRVRSAVLELLTTQTSAQLATADGKSSLKSAITHHLSETLGHEVIDVLFTDFVVQ